MNTSESIRKLIAETIGELKNFDNLLKKKAVASDQTSTPDTDND